MKFFVLSRRESGPVLDALHAQEAKDSQEHSQVHLDSVDGKIVMSVQNLLGEERLRKAIKSIVVEFEELDTRPEADPRPPSERGRVDIGGPTMLRGR